jgi:hypothetical protein
MTKKATTTHIVRLLEIIAAELQEQGERLRRIEALQRPAGPHPSDRELLAKLDREAAGPALLPRIGDEK